VKVAHKTTIPLILSHYWIEQISRKEALRRLASRKLDPRRHKAIASRIPERTLHILKFHDRIFKEYVRFGKGSARILLMLPMRTNGDTFHVICPMLDSGRLERNRRTQPAHVEFHEFKVSDGRLYEGDELRETFKFTVGPTKVLLNLAPLFGVKEEHNSPIMRFMLTDAGDGGVTGDDSRDGYSGGGWGLGPEGDDWGSWGSEAGMGSDCCGACEWVHSALKIHRLDWLCCLGGCGEGI